MSTPSAPSIVRTLVPLAVGQVVSFFATLGLEVSDDQQAAFTTVFGFIVAGAYYLAVRFLEQKFPKVGAFLGWAATPDGYSTGTTNVSPDIVGEEAFFDDQDEEPEDEGSEDLDDLEVEKADEQAELDKSLT